MYSFLTFFGYTIGLTIIILFILLTVRQHLFFSEKIQTKQYRVVTNCICIYLICAVLLGLSIQSLYFFPSTKISEKYLWYIQNTCALLILALTSYIIAQFLRRYKSIITLLRYSISILIVLIGGRFLFIQLAFLTEMFSAQIGIWHNLHFRFVFFIISHFFISIALLHLLTKTQFLIFLPEKLLPTSALLVTSLDTIYSLSILI